MRESYHGYRVSRPAVQSFVPLSEWFLRENSITWRSRVDSRCLLYCADYLSNYYTHGGVAVNRTNSRRKRPPTFGRWSRVK